MVNNTYNYLLSDLKKLKGVGQKTYIDNFDLDKLNELEKFLSIDDDTLYKFYNNQLEQIDHVNEEMIKLYKNHKYKK